MTPKKYLVIIPASNGFIIRRGDSSHQETQTDEFYVVITPEAMSELVLEHCRMFDSPIADRKKAPTLDEVFKQVGIEVVPLKEKKETL